MSDPDNITAEILAELRRINARLDELTVSKPEVILTRAAAAKELKVSLRQLFRLIGAGHLRALPSGIARAELERYAATPAERIRYRPNGDRAADAKSMAARLRQRLREDKVKGNGSVQ